MNLDELTQEMIRDLILLNTCKKDNFEPTGFATGYQSRQVTFDIDFENNLAFISECIFKNTKFDFKIEALPFKKIVKKAVVNLITSNNFDVIGGNCLTLLKNEIDILIQEIETEHVEIIPIRSLGLEKENSIEIGPVTLYSLEDWINCSEFSSWLLERYGNTKTNSEWKINILRKIKDKDVEISGIAEEIYNFIKDYNAILKVRLNGYESEFSIKLSKLVAKTALDMISLYQGKDTSFFKQVIHGERLGPNMTYSLKEYKGYLGLPGSSLQKQVHPVFYESEQIQNFISEFTKFKKYFAFMLEGFTNKNVCKHPLLTHRWIFALNWYAEGIREPNDIIAVAKLACCLDTLSNGGKKVGIKKLLTNMLGIESGQIIFKDGLKNIELDDFVQKIYNQGRSRILHGTIEDMLESYDLDKRRLISCGRIVLLESLVRLVNYEGPDNGNAFQNMK
ncbi:hypothetical protein [Acinetobacter nosocomialis]|uniref:hypothetical protein n=1 Tax=Acinetobacter nosocomialis TaxID=106654 RepID=UPI0005EB7ED9|nr:hypothetical protein [Acinetobacter nosocomialis]